jgi:hypothetical protein
MRLWWLRQSWGFAGTVFEDVPRGRVCVRVSIVMSVRAWWVSPMYCVIRKKSFHRKSELWKAKLEISCVGCWLQVGNGLFLPLLLICGSWSPVRARHQSVVVCEPNDRVWPNQRLEKNFQFSLVNLKIWSNNKWTILLYNFKLESSRSLFFLRNRELYFTYISDSVQPNTYKDTLEDKENYK